MIKEIGVFERFQETSSLKNVYLQKSQNFKCIVNQGIEISVSNPTSESHAGFIPLVSLNKIQAS